MKLTIVAVIVTLCLVVAVNADILPQDDVDSEYYSMDLAESEIVDIEASGFIYWTLKAALRSLKGINCSIKGVLNIKAAGEKFLTDVNACGGNVSKQLQSVINAVNNVINTAKSIITLNDAACKNGNYNDETDGNKKTPFFSCFWKMLNKMWTLNNQIKKVINLIQKVPDAGVGAGGCVKNALNELQGSFTQFPAWVKTCSQLTSGKKG